MLHSLEIRNYRNLRHLTIEKLGRVNLLVGKNNTGKTSVLEAVGILTCEADSLWLYQLLVARGEIGYLVSDDRNEYMNNNVQALSNLFYGRKGVFDPSKAIRIQQTSNDAHQGIEPIILRFAYYFEELNIHTNQISVTYVASGIDGLTKIGLEISTIIDSRKIIPLNIRLGKQTAFSNSNENVQFVRTNEITRSTNGLLWDKVTLTPKQEIVIDALKIIEPTIDLLNFIAGLNQDERKPLIKLRNDSSPIYLSSMGDGINRILTIILAMVNCENGYLLIDEFENGLHYSVQEKLWEIVFYLAERLNIQVFATTHSLDCVEAFSAVLNNGKQDKVSGMLIRLENYEGSIEATVYDADEIQSTTRVHVDPR